MRLLRNKLTVFMIILISIIALIFITRFLLSNQNNAINYTIAGQDGEHPTVYDVSFLFENKTPYIGNHVKVGTLNRGMPLPDGLTRGILKLSTEKPPYGMTYHYHLKDDSIDLTDQTFILNEEQFLKNSVLLFALVDNVDEITHLGFWNNKALSSLPFSYTYTRADAERIIGGDVRQFAKTTEKLAELIEIVELLSADDLSSAINNIAWWKAKYPVISDVKFHLLKDEYLERNDVHNPDLCLLIREYIVFDGTAEEWNQVYPETNKITLPKSDTITTASDFKSKLIKLNPESTSLKLPPNTIVSSFVLTKWKAEQYNAKYEYYSESPKGLTYEMLISLPK